MPAILIGNGGLGHVIQARYRVDGYPGFIGLQVVQVFYGTPAEGDPPGLFEFDVSGAVYNGYVDGGYKSRNALQSGTDGHVPGKPYYYRENALKLPQNYAFDSATGRGSIIVYDEPMGVRIHDRGFFETAIVARPTGGGPDQVVHVLRWGWIRGGTEYRPAPDIEGVSYRPLESTTVSRVFKDILADNYADYHFQDHA